MAFFSWNITKFALQLEFSPKPGLWYALVAPVCSAHWPFEAFEKKNSIFSLSTSLPLNKIQVAISGATKEAKKA